MTDLSPRDRRCYLLFGYTPKRVSHRRANLALNEFVADKRRGLVLYHDHFVDKPGGLAVIFVETPEDLGALRDPGPLAGWTLYLHPLIFSDSAVRFLFQVDYTMTAYRGKRLRELMTQYESSRWAQGLDRQWEEKITQTGTLEPLRVQYRLTD
jgi:hypothetical protein